MPELVTSPQYEVQLSEAERDRYEDLKQELILQLPGGEITAANAASSPESSPSRQTVRSIPIPAKSSSFMTGSWTLWRISSKPPMKNHFCGLLVPSRADPHQEPLFCPGRSRQAAILLTECGKDSCSSHPPRFCRARLKPSGRRFYPCLVRLTWSLELYQQTNARLWRQGTNLRNRGDPAHHHERYHRRAHLESAVQEGMTQAALIDAVKAEVV